MLSLDYEFLPAVSRYSQKEDLYLCLYCLQNYHKEVQVYIVDFFSLAIGLVVEIDGSQHYRENNRKYDNQRSNDFAKYSLKTIRFNNYEVATNLEDVIEAIIKNVNELRR